MVPDNTTVLLFLVWYIQEMHLGTIFILRKDVLASLEAPTPYVIRTFSVHKVRENCHFLFPQPTPMSLRNIKMVPYRISICLKIALFLLCLPDVKGAIKISYKIVCLFCQTALHKKKLVLGNSYLHAFNLCILNLIPTFLLQEYCSVGILCILIVYVLCNT